MLGVFLLVHSLSADMLLCNKMDSVIHLKSGFKPHM